MRDFFKSELKTLKIKTNLNQYENLSALPDAEAQISLLLDSLARVTNEPDFAYIPDHQKKRIIQEQIYRDPDFTGLTPRVVWKWLNAEKGKYFRESAHIPTESNAKPVAYENLAPEIKTQVDEFMRSLQEPSRFQMPAVSQKEIDDLKIEDLEHVEGRRGTYYQSTATEDYILQQKKLQWARECTDLHTGRLLPGALSFNEWLLIEKPI